MENKKKRKYNFYTLIIVIITITIGGWNNCTGQTFPDTVAYDQMEKFDWHGNWWAGAPTTGFFTNASKSPTTSAVIYGSGGGADEYDWYSLPNIDTLDPLQEYKVQINLASYRFTSTGGFSGVDIDDYVDIQVSTDGVTYISEVRITGNSGAYWGYNSKTVTKMVNGILEIHTPGGGGDRTALGDGYSIVELIFPIGTKMIAIDVLAVVDRAGEEWWFDDFFLLGSGSGGTSLPIVLTEFEAAQDGTQVNVSWNVLSQVNNDYFTVERSTDCYNWEVVGQCSGNGTTNQETGFVMVDRNPYTGTSYYRLIQTDFNEASETFAPVSVYVKDKLTIGLNIRPNPAIDYIELEMDYTMDPNISHNVQIYDMEGHRVYKKHFIGGIHDFKINIQKFPSGAYLLKTQSNDINGEGKFIKQ